MDIILEVLAHDGEEVIVQTAPTLDQVIRANSIEFSISAVILLLLLTVFSILIKQKSEWVKYLLFGSFVVVALITTIYLAGSTIYLNQKSETKGPVHWHADFEIYKCGQKLDLIDPKGWDNKVGTSLLHEHNDNRIHVEGPVIDFQEITLGKFLEAVGFLPMESGMGCNGEPVEPQVFVFRTDGNTFYQEKIADWANYVLSPYSSIPPGDCIIIELDKIKQKTDKLCNFYKVAKEKGELVEK